MTFAIFILILLGVFVALLNALPPVSALPVSNIALIWIIGQARAWDFLLPIHELFTLLYAVIIYEVTVWIWHVSWRVVKFLRGHSDGG